MSDGEAEEGLLTLQAMCREHLALLAERAEAILLVGCQNPAEDFLGALRNVLQSRLSSIELNANLLELLDMIADEFGLPRTGDGEPRSWSGQTLLNHVGGLVAAERNARAFRDSLVTLLGLKPTDDVLLEIARLKASSSTKE